jgi:hypothetical protein
MRIKKLLVKKKKNLLYYSKFIDFINDFDNIIIISKGYQFNDFISKKPDEKTLYIGIKQSILLLPKKDILVMNDYEGLFGLEDIICDIKIIICPTIIHYKHRRSNVSNIKFQNYLKLNKFKGQIIYFSMINKYTEFLYFKPVDSAEVIFYILDKLNISNKNINIYGLYSNIKDNKFMMNKIKNVKIDEDFKDDYNSYLERIINKKVEVNKRNICQNGLIDETLKKKKIKLIRKFADLFNKNNIEFCNQI